MLNPVRYSIVEIDVHSLPSRSSSRIGRPRGTLLAYFIKTVSLAVCSEKIRSELHKHVENLSYRSQTWRLYITV